RRARFRGRPRARTSSRSRAATSRGGALDDPPVPLFPGLEAAEAYLARLRGQPRGALDVARQESRGEDRDAHRLDPQYLDDQVGADEREADARARAERRPAPRLRREFAPRAGLLLRETQHAAGTDLEGDEVLGVLHPEGQA